MFCETLVIFFLKLSFFISDREMTTEKQNKLEQEKNKHEFDDGFPNIHLHLNRGKR